MLKINRARKKAFTLIELIVVISIIAILAALILPALAKAKEKALRTSCMAHTKMLAYALTMYCQQYNDNMPNAPTQGSWAWDVSDVVADDIIRNGADRDIFYCPAFPDMNNDYLWNLGSYRVMGYALSFPNQAAIESIYQNPKIVPTEIQMGPIVLPAPDATTRVLLADATVSHPGQTDTNNRGNNTYTGVKGGWAEYHRTNHLVSQASGYPSGGNEAMLDAHSEWHDFSSMIPVGGFQNGTPVFWW